MTDTREAILSYMHEHLLANISGAESVWRNRGGLGDPMPPLPAVILLDADEVPAFETEAVARLKSIRMPPAPFILKPQIWAVLPRRDDRTNMTVNGVASPVGQDISSWRMKIKDAVENDAGLMDLLGSGGQIIYAGCETDMKTRSTIGALGAQLLIKYELRYMLFPPRS